jgi:hypothetical protein
MQFLIWTFILLSSVTRADPYVKSSIATARRYGFNIVHEKGKPIQITWPDGREAASFKRSSKPLRLSMPLQITENLCVPIAPRVSCTYNMDFKIEAMDIRWVRHPNASRVGKIVGRYESGTRHAMWTSQLKYLAPVSTSDLKEDELVCERWDWLPGAEKKAPPSTVKMSSLEGDYNMENYFLDSAINQGFSGVYDVIWKRTENGSLKMIESGKVFAQSKFFAPPFLGFMMSFTIENAKAKSPQEKYCQITVRPDSTKLNTARSEGLNKAEPIPYAVGSDDLYDYLQLTYDAAKEIFQLGEEKTKNGKTSFQQLDVM